MATATEVRERPILFSGPMVQAILAGRKTQTRRVVSPRNSTVLGYPGSKLWGHLHFDYDRDGIRTYVDTSLRREGWDYLHVPAWHPDETEEVVSYRVRPAIRPGDILWVRETWQPIWAEDEPPPHGLASPEGWAIGYVATDGVQEWHDEDRGATTRCRPAIHMPRWASRLTLEVTDVRVERLQDISEADARAEGCGGAPVPGCGVDDRWCHGTCKRHGSCQYVRPAVMAFRDLWDGISGKRPGCSWAENPWVWAITFRPLPSSSPS